MKADMHVHSYYSDGLLSPAEIVAEAKRRGVELISITDHDTAFGREEVKKLCHGAGIAAVDGVEFSAYDGDIKVHTLCYGCDAENADFKALFNELNIGAFKRAEDIIFKLKKCGIAISMEEVLKERSREEIPVHSIHIARVAARKGYGSSPYTFYAKYLTLGNPAFSKVCRPSPERVTEVIKAAGGVSSLAHPGRIDLNAHDLKSLILRMKSVGLCGIEAVYSTHTVKETAYYKELAKELGLLVTGGSDTHALGGNKNIGSPDFEPSAELLQKLKLC